MNVTCIRDGTHPLLRTVLRPSSSPLFSLQVHHKPSSTSYFRIIPSASSRYLTTTTTTKMAAQDTPSGSSGTNLISKITDWVKPGDTSGEFKRQQSSFRSTISSSPNSEFPPEAGRYHLYISYACPWANRTLIARKLKGLEEIISFSAVHWHMGDKGWRFPTPSDTDAEGENVTPSPIPQHSSFSHLSQVYFQVSSNYSGRFTVPVLFDKKSQKIVNNESSEILRMLNTEFNSLLPPQFASVDLYPADLRQEIDEANEWQYDQINNGVYKSGFATTQEAYERNVLTLFKALDRAEKHLAEGQGPYWFGERLTEVDIRLFVTIIRFDPVYVQHFKCNLRDIRSGYPALHKWMQNLYWNIPAFEETTNFLHIKNHYTKSHTNINPLSITPLGPSPDILPLGEEVAAAAAARK
ncbi:putative glutathione transferase omega [Podospora australis]|uniref:Glutathione S-transferase omega-like 2 n=1 Tax=Podospora australis TaxID=1536484 RepID=A0AAN7ALW9_9PEZI|nr:putative glutathione transferase omega [Podospora australis]